MFVILALDGLELELVEKFKCKNLMQDKYGKTDLSDFSEPRTVVLWSSFLTGKNQEKRVLKENLWSFKLDKKETFFNSFEKPIAIDVPGYNYQEIHKTERDLLKGYFDEKNSLEDYNENALKGHQIIKGQFFEHINDEFDILMVYFGIADVFGHLNFGIEAKMRPIYQELDDIAEKMKKKFSQANCLIISDHGMKKIGQFGDHSNYGFWSVNFDTKMQNPKITDFYKLILAEKRMR